MAPFSDTIGVGGLGVGARPPSPRPDRGRLARVSPLVYGVKSRGEKSIVKFDASFDIFFSPSWPRRGLEPAGHWPRAGQVLSSNGPVLV